MISLLYLYNILLQNLRKIRMCAGKWLLIRARIASIVSVASISSLNEMILPAAWTPLSVRQARAHCTLLGSWLCRSAIPPALQTALYITCSMVLAVSV